MSLQDDIFDLTDDLNKIPDRRRRAAAKERFSRVLRRLSVAERREECYLEMRGAIDTLKRVLE